MKLLASAILLSFVAVVHANAYDDVVNLRRYFFEQVNLNNKSFYITYIMPAMNRFLFKLQYYGNYENPRLAKYVQPLRVEAEQYDLIFATPREPHLTTAGKVFKVLLSSNFTNEEREKIVSDNSYFFAPGKYETYQEAYYKCRPLSAGYDIDYAKQSSEAKGYVNGNLTNVFNNLANIEHKTTFTNVFDSVISPNLIYKHGYSYMDVAVLFEKRLSNYHASVTLPTIVKIRDCKVANADDDVFINYSLRNFMHYVLDAFNFYAFQTTRAIYAENGAAEYNDPATEREVVTFYAKDYPAGTMDKLYACFPEFFAKFKSSTGKDFDGSGIVFTAQYGKRLVSS